MDLDFDDPFVDTPPQKKVAKVASTPEKHACRGEPTAVERGSTHVAYGVQGLRFSHEVCKEADCVECHVRKLYKSMVWRSAASLQGPAREKVGKFWVATKLSSTGAFMGVGCQVCYQFTKARLADKKSMIGGKILGSFATCNINKARALQRSHLVRHADSTWHQAAVEWVGGEESKAFMAHAPSCEDFQKLWDHIRVGNSRMKCEAIGAMRHKLTRMSWCLAEGVRVVQRRFLEKARSIAIMQDKKDAELSMRFSAASNDLEQMSGFLGTIKSKGGHVDIVKSTLGILKMFCTSSHNRPRAAGAQETPAPGPVNSNLLKRIKSSIEFHASDAEGAMLLASQKMKSEFENMLAGMWDLAHGFRRITQRPWAKDKILKSLIARIVTGPQSIVRLVQNSPEFSEWYCDIKDKLKQTIHGKVSNFSWAGHRFDSQKKPLGRAVLGIFALIKTARRINILRPNTVEAAGANKFLAYINIERVLLLAMCADAADEVDVILRFVDKEDFPVEEVPDQVRFFMTRIRLLFIGGRCVDSGYTAWALQAVKKPCTFFVHKSTGLLKTIGNPSGVQQSTIDKCLKRLACWVVVSESIVQAEFPDFLILGSLENFKLGGTEQRPARVPDDVNKGLKKMAAFFCVDPGRLKQQYETHYPIAQALRSADSSMSSKDAWKAAIDKTQRRKDVAENHPVDALLPVLVRFLSWKPSSCGLEQDFSRMDKIICKRAKLLGIGSKNNLFGLGVAKLTKAQEQEAKEIAQSLWADHFGLARQGCKSRIDQGIAKKRPVTTSTEVGFLRKRKRDVEKMARNHVGSVPSLDTVEKEDWMNDEIRFQKQKRQKRMIHAALENQLSPQEAKRIKGDVEKHLIVEAKRDKVRKRQHEKRCAILKDRKPSVIPFRNKKVFIDKVGNRRQAERASTTLGMKVTANRWDANIIVVEDLSKLGQRSSWCVAFRGGWAICQKYLVSAGQSGTMLTFQRALDTKQRFWVSARFAEHHHTLYDMLEKLIVGRDSFWEFFEGTEEDFKREAKRKKGALLGLVTLKEKREATNECARIHGHGASHIAHNLAPHVSYPCLFHIAIVHICWPRLTRTPYILLAGCVVLLACFAHLMAMSIDPCC